MADEHKTEHEPGTMDISMQEKTFDGFVRRSIQVACVAIGLLVFAALVNS